MFFALSFYSHSMCNLFRKWGIRVKLSACMIVKNEADNIARCIDSYRNVVSEIIVVDTGSTDDTVDIAKELGAKVFHYQWDNHFANARNYAIAQANGDWIIFLDADEYFAENMSEQIPWLVKKAVNSGHDAIACKLINIDTDKGSLLDEMFQIRIFRRHKHIRFQNSIHEVLHKKNSGKVPTLFAGPSQLAIYHTGYSDSISRDKAARNLPLLLDELDKTSNKSDLYQYLSDCYLTLDNWQESIRYAKLFIDSGGSMRGYQTKPYINIITATAKLTQDPGSIYREIAAAVARFPQQPIFRFYLGRFFQNVKRYEAAYAEYQAAAALQAGYQDIEVNPLHASLADMYCSLGVLAEQRQWVEQALEYYVASLQANNRWALGFTNLVRLIQLFPAEDIIALLNSLYNLESESDLDFLVDQLTEFALPEVLAYYATLRLKKFNKEDILLLYTLLANGQYDKSFTVIKEYYHESPVVFAEILLAAAGLLSEQPVYVTWLCEHTTAPMQNVLWALVNQEAVEWGDEEKSRYFDLLQRLLSLGNQSYVDKLLALRKQFGQADVLFRLSDIFFTQQSYGKAYDLYAEFIVVAEADDWRVKLAMFNMALCHYHQKDYSQAVRQLLQAYSQGYRSNALYEYLRWSIRDGQERELAVQAMGDNWQLVRDADLCLWE